jgi:restriction endonuclease S subunit
MSEYQFKEQIKELEKQIEQLKEEQQRYLKILSKRHEELSNNEELERIPTCLSHYIYEKIHELSNGESNLQTKIELEKDIDKAVDYLLKIYNR